MFTKKKENQILIQFGSWYQYTKTKYRLTNSSAHIEMNIFDLADISHSWLHINTIINNSIPFIDLKINEKQKHCDQTLTLFIINLENIYSTYTNNANQNLP